MDPIFINALAFQQDGMWVAQCLEYNFVSFAKTQEDLPDVLMTQILAQIEIDAEDGHDPFFEFEPAPQKYWDLYERAKRQSTPVLYRSAVLPAREVEAHVVPLAA